MADETVTEMLPQDPPSEPGANRPVQKLPVPVISGEVEPRTNECRSSHECGYLQISGPHPLRSHRVFLNASFILGDRSGTRKKALINSREDRVGRGGLSFQQRRGCEVLLERAGVERRKYLDPQQEPEQHQVPIRMELSE